MGWVEPIEAKAPRMAENVPNPFISIWLPEVLRGKGWSAEQPLTLNLIEVAGLLLGQQGRVGILPRIHLVDKEGPKPAAFIVLGVETVGQKSSGRDA